MRVVDDLGKIPIDSRSGRRDTSIVGRCLSKVRNPDENRFQNQLRPRVLETGKHKRTVIARGVDEMLSMKRTSSRAASGLKNRSRKTERRRIRHEALERRRLLAGNLQDPGNVHIVPESVTPDSFEIRWDPAENADGYRVAVDIPNESYSPSDGPEPTAKCTTDDGDHYPPLTEPPLSRYQTSIIINTYNGAPLESSQLYTARVCSVQRNKVSEGEFLNAVTDPAGEDPGVLGNWWNYPHRIAVSNDGHKLVVFANHLDNEWHLRYALYGDQGELETGRIYSAGNRNVNASMFDADWGNMDVAAGDAGQFVIGWLDESAEGNDPRVNMTRFFAGSGPENVKSFALEGNYDDGDTRLDGLHGINVDMSPNGDAAVAVNDSAGLSHSTLRVYYHENSATAQWTEIAGVGTLLDAPGGEEDTLQGHSPAMEMDTVGNVMVAFATDNGAFSGNQEVYYAIYDKQAENWGPGRQLVTYNWYSIESVLLTVDKTRDLTSTSGDNRGLAGLAWTASANDAQYVGTKNYASIFYNGEIDGRSLVALQPDSAGVLNGFDLADGAGHVLATWTKGWPSEQTTDQELVHYWFEDADNDGILDLDMDGNGEIDPGRGWQLEPQVVNDGSIDGAPYTGNVFAQYFESRNPARLGVSATGGLIVWSNTEKDAVYYRKIDGFDTQTRSVILQSDFSVDDGILDRELADAGVSADVNYQTGEGVALYHSETDSRLHVETFNFGGLEPTPAIVVNPASDLTTSEDGTTTTFDVMLGTQPTADVTVSLTSSDSTEGEVSPATLTFTTTDWDTPQTVIVTGVQDTDVVALIDYEDVDYQINLASSSTDADYSSLSSSVALTNVNTDDPPPSFSIDDVSVAEGDSGTTTASFTVTRSGDASGAVSVSYETQNGSAATPADYVDIVLTTLNFASGETTKTINVIVNGDELDEGDEDFYVNLSSPSVGTSITKAQGVGTIQDDDAPVATAMHVADLDATSTSASRGKWDASVTVRVVDESGTAVSGATVNFVWSNGATGSATTDDNGIAVVSWSDINNKTKSVTFTITSLVHASFTYDEASNSDPDGDSDGTNITVDRP